MHLFMNCKIQTGDFDRVTMSHAKLSSELLIREGIEDNSKIIFLISQ